MGGSEKFCLKWNDFETNISTAFRDLREEKEFFDCTLMSCDDEQLNAHKVILSACSPMFRNVLRRNPTKEPVLWLKGVKFSDLQAILTFMYNGEVNVAQDDLNSFLAVAEELKVKGLTSSNTDRPPRHVDKTRTPPPGSTAAARRLAPLPGVSKPAPATTAAAFPGTGAAARQDEDDIQEVHPSVKTEPTAAVAEQGGFSGSASSSQQLQHMEGDEMQYQDENYDDYGQYGAEGGYEGDSSGMADAASKVSGHAAAAAALAAGAGLKTIEDLKRFIERDPVKGRYCSICKQYWSKSVTNIRNHIESKHFPIFLYTCVICGKTVNTTVALDRHKVRCRKESMGINPNNGLPKMLSHDSSNDGSHFDPANFLRGDFSGDRSDRPPIDPSSFLKVEASDDDGPLDPQSFLKLDYQGERSPNPASFSKERTPVSPANIPHKSYERPSFNPADIPNERSHFTPTGIPNERQTFNPAGLQNERQPFNPAGIQNERLPFNPADFLSGDRTAFGSAGFHPGPGSETSAPNDENGSEQKDC